MVNNRYVQIRHNLNEFGMWSDVMVIVFGFVNGKWLGLNVCNVMCYCSIGFHKSCCLDPIAWVARGCRRVG